MNEENRIQIGDHVVIDEHWRKVEDVQFTGEGRMVIDTQHDTPEDVDPYEKLIVYECPYCDDTFDTERGKNIHKGRKHPDEEITLPEKAKKGDGDSS